MTSGVAPAVSVIIGAYNPGTYLREAINSVVTQTFGNWELIVVDDGSYEDLAWVSSVDPRVSLVRQRRQGKSTARNRGITVSRGRFVAFLDADDRWRPTKLERQIEVLRAGSVFCHTAFDIIDSEGVRIGPGWGEQVNYLDLLAGRLGILHSSSIVERAALHRVGLFDSTLQGQEDLDLFLRLTRSYEVSYVSTVEVDYRVHGGNASKDYWRSVRALRNLYAREASLGASRNDTLVARAISEGELRVRRTYAFKAIDAARAAAQRHSIADTARHLAHATRLSPRVVQNCCVLSVKRHIHR